MNSEGDTMNSEGGYVCTLTEASLEKAKKELNEDPKNRMGAVETFRTWIKQQPHFRCRTDTAFLLRFLRYCKFSQLEARKRLEKYLTAMTKYAEYATDIDMTKKELQIIHKTRQIVPLGLDSEGRQVVMIRIALFDPKTLDMRHWTKAAFLAVMHHLLRDENSSVNGFIYFLDGTGVELKHKLYWGLDDIKRHMHIVQNCMPARIKGIHYYNLGIMGEAMMQMFMAFMSKKLRDRIVLHGNNLESVYKVLPMEIFPDEYLPDDYTGKKAGTCQSIADKFIEDITKPEGAAYLWEVTAKANASMDESKRPASREPAESFRKLNVD